ncbi:MAG TPA: Omp28-related outer membrane protein [Flavobacteriales bacterium]|nr:Omp28-related outer membrane protein [Flavobacteriales bacterium]
MRILFLFAAVGLMAAGCDKVDDPIERRSNSGGPGATVKRRALLEEFTGHHCNNCPAAHAVAAQLKNLYGDDLILVGLHAAANFNSSFIVPQSNPDGSYATDFRTTEGQAYAINYAVTFLPSGMVSRRPYNSSTVLASASWGSAIEEIVNEDALFDVWVSDLQHNAGANTVTATVKVAVLQGVTGEYKLTTYLLEDNIIDWQYNSQATPPDVPNYNHRHVFRKTLDGAWGQVAIASGASEGDTLTFTYAGVSMNPAWNASNCELVSYMHKTSNNEVMQAAIRKFQP